jgi:hypothetical protein
MLKIRVEKALNYRHVIKCDLKGRAMGIDRNKPYNQLPPLPPNKTIKKARTLLPSHVYSKELIELLFEQPFCKVQYVVDKGIAKRQTAADYLYELEKIGIQKKLWLERNICF